MPETPNLDAQVNGPQYLGPATFMKVRALTEPEELERAAPDVAIVGAPWDDGTTYRPGARFGPRAVRIANYQPPSWHLDLQVALDGPEFIYLSIDIDVLDPGFAPGTGTPEPGGMQPADLLRAIRNIGLRTKLVGMDVVEVSPPYDHAEITAQNANRCILEAISTLAVKKSRGGTR